jgi:hypothetical protein
LSSPEASVRADRGGPRPALLATLVGALALAGANVAVARAGTPELGRCVKVPSAGAYETSKCITTSPSHNGRYEWEPGLAKPGVKFASKSSTAPAVFHTSGYSILVVCYGGVTGSGTGTPEELTGVTLRFAGCTEEVTGTPKCTTPGLAEGEVEATALAARFGIISGSPLAVGLVLRSVGTEPFGVLGCPRWPSLWGGVITKVKSDAMAGTQKLVYKDLHSRGQQQYQQFEGEPTEVLHFESAEGRAAALEATVVLTFEEKAEINTAV